MSSSWATYSFSNYCRLIDLLASFHSHTKTPKRDSRPRELSVSMEIKVSTPKDSSENSKQPETRNRKPLISIKHFVALIFSSFKSWFFGPTLTDPILLKILTIYSARRYTKSVYHRVTTRPASSTCPRNRFSLPYTVDVGTEVKSYLIVETVRR